MKQIQSHSSSVAQQLENALTDILTHKDIKDLSNKFFNNLIETSSSALDTVSVDSQKFAASTKSLAGLWQKYYSLKKQGKEQTKKVLNNAQNADLSAQALLAQIFTERQKINHITGQMFENLIQLTVPLITDVAQASVDDIVKSLQTSIESQGKIKTAGSSKGKQITFTLDGDSNTVKWQGTGKTDIRIVEEGPFHSFNISAKSYNNLNKHITLYTGKLLPLIADWPVDEKTKTYFYNALRESPDTFLIHTRTILAIQSLIGVSSDAGELANVLVIYNRSASAKNNKIVSVIPIKQLLEDILVSNNPALIEASFPMILKSMPIKRNTAHTYAEDAQKIILNTKLNKAYCQVKGIEYLKKKL